MPEADVLIARRINEFRTAQGISIAELARRIDIDKKRLWYVLNGQRTMRVDEFIKLCAFFNLGFGCFISRAAIERLRSPWSSRET